MPNYKRCYKHGGCYFFTVVSYERRKILIDNISKLRGSFKTVMGKHPFEIESIVVLPDHIHCIWNLPLDDADYSTRWMLIKKRFSSGIKAPRNKRREKEVWQLRFWEHYIRDEEDWRNHMDYIHFNPVKHGYVKRPIDWEYGSFRKWIRKGMYSRDWGKEMPENIGELDYE